VGGTVTDSLEVPGDHDWFAITLTAGQQVVVALDGVTLEDPYLYIRDSSGNVVASNDDIVDGINRNSKITFDPGYSGTYYIDAGAFNNNYTGTYQLSVQPYTPPFVATFDQIADQLVNGFWDGDHHHFNVTQGGTLTVNISTLNAAEQALARAALQEWSDIIGVQIQEVTTGGQIVFDDSEDNSGNPVAATDAVWSNGLTTSAHVHISNSWVQAYGTGLNTYSFQTYIHEIGHALGLGHAGDYNDTATYPNDAKFVNDAWSTSVMSYFDQHQNYWFNNQGFSLDYAVTPMGADILAMQTLYGLSTTTRTGATTYGYNSNAGGIYDATIYPNVAYTIFDNGGTDTIDFSGTPSNQTINLNAETFSNVNGNTGNLYIARDVVIENAIGGSGNDTIIQNSANNVLSGGAGNDTVSYETATAGVSVNLSLTTAQDTGGGGVDTLSGFENLVGSAFSDSLIGGPTTVSISGGAGDDWIDAGTANPTSRLNLSGGDGNDTFVLGVDTGPFVIDGGSGFNAVDGSKASGGLLLSTNQIAPGGVDWLLGVHKIIGSNYADTLIAGFTGDILIGGAGDDTLTSNQGGTQLAGGTGNDIYNVRSTTDQVIENAGEGVDTVNAACTYTLGANFENLTLHEYLPWDPYAGAALTPPPSENRSATGNDLPNVITGNLGDDVLTGLAGADTLTGGGGNDAFQDTVAGLNGDTITDFGFGDKIVISDATLASFNFSVSGNTLNYSGGVLTFGTALSGTLVATAAQGGGVQLSLAQTITHAVADDFNRDGRSDVLWRHDSGYMSDWLGLSNGALQDNAAYALTNVPTAWQIAGTGDFNGDGDSDILWRNTSTGAMTDWLGLANGGFQDNAANGYTIVPSAWKIAGVGDFNGDGRADILWRNTTTGDMSNWLGLLNGGFKDNAANGFINVPMAWQVAGVGDFNGDGRNDILWRNTTTGAMTDWLGLLNGGFQDNAPNGYTIVPVSWQVAGVGDFNGDGRADILWRNTTTGDISNWLGLPNGGFQDNAANGYTNVPLAWQVAAVADYNGDGRSDILWHNSSMGATTDWLGLSNGGFQDNSANFYTYVPNSWHAVSDPHSLI